jgi:AraC-like DNA-binding protein
MKSNDNIISTVCEFLESHCKDPLTLDDIADASGLDRFALCRYFKKHHKRSVMDELKAIRIKKAKRLLLYSSQRIGEIGRLCGFESPSYFALRFREECGCSPAKYRELRT